MYWGEFGLLRHSVVWSPSQLCSYPISSENWLFHWLGVFWLTKMVDVKLHHLSSCDKSTRHHALQKGIFNFSRDAGLNPAWEVKCFDDSKHRPGDVYFPHFPAISDKKVAIDLTIISGHSNFKSSSVRQNTIKNLQKKTRYERKSKTASVFSHLLCCYGYNWSLLETSL